MKIYTKNNFHKHTFCIFKEVTADQIENLKLNYTSSSGSCYYFTEEGVFRKSNHWGRAANCKWRLQAIENNKNKTKIGYANWNEFHSINNTEKLFYIKVDFTNKSVQYYHKNLNSDGNLFLRNASQTTKRVQEIRHLFVNSKKLEYWDYSQDFETLLKTVIQYLINTDLTLFQIKQKINA